MLLNFPNSGSNKKKMFPYKLKPNGKTSNCDAASKRGFSSHAMCEYSTDSIRILGDGEIRS